jgi:hypothetical protein
MTEINKRVSNHWECDTKTCYLLADGQRAAEAAAAAAAAAQVSSTKTSSTSITPLRRRTLVRRMTPTGTIVESESFSSTTTTATATATATASSTTIPPRRRQEQHPSSCQSGSPPMPVKQKPPPPTATSATTSPLPHVCKDDSDSESDLTVETCECSLRGSGNFSLRVSLLSSIDDTLRVSLLPSTEDASHVIKYPLVDNCGNAGLYTGHLSRDSNKPHGFGHMEYDSKPPLPDSDDDDVGVVVYQGEWLMGDWCGFGKLTNATYTYQGGFFDNMKHGLGVVRYHHDEDNNDDTANGINGRTLTYDGAFSFDSILGKGHMLYPDGSKFWGYWNEKGLPHGRGKQSFADGRVYDGEFDCGALQPHGRMTWPDGRWYLGEWMDGQRTGLGIEVLPNGELYHEGTFCNGTPAEASSFPSHPKSRGKFLIYQTSSTGYSTSRGALLGKLPREVHMRKSFRWMLK